MTVSKKQLKANKKNAQKGGVKTDEGKAIVKYNALKHGLLAKEVVITVGDGAESADEFSVLLQDLKTQLAPFGSLEEMLVEKIAVAYWRLRRAYRYEVGLLRNELDNAADDFYSNPDWKGKRVKTDEEIDKEIEKAKDKIKYWKKDKVNLTRMYKQGKSLEDTYDWEENWYQLYDKHRSLFSSEEQEKIEGPKEVREFLNKEQDWSDDDIWQALIEICDERVEHCEQQIEDLEKQKPRNRLKLQVIKKLGSIPKKDELDRLLRYEGAIERQFYRAMNQLERLQRLRLGDKVPAPVEVDLNVDRGQSD
ncbi:MAG: hypothetical protein ACYTEL_06405 [Planctomycetota bacterium]|jgi:hypothetical protein